MVHSLIFVRERPEQLTWSGCCGKLEGDNVGAEFAEVGCTSAQVGPLYLSAQEIDGVQAQILDPRNPFALWWHLVGDALRHGVGPGPLLRAICLATPVPSVFLDGRMLWGGVLPTAEEFQRRVRGEIA